MNRFEFVLAIIVILGLFSIIRARMGLPVIGGRSGSRPGIEPADSADADRLRDEVRQLKERIQVLERITVDKENSLSRQIEELRDRS